MAWQEYDNTFKGTLSEKELKQKVLEEIFDLCVYEDGCGEKRAMNTAKRAIDFPVVTSHVCESEKEAYNYFTEITKMGKLRVAYENDGAIRFYDDYNDVDMWYVQTSYNPDIF